MRSSRPDSASALLKKFSNVRVAVVGDVMLDEYTIGVIERLSPEAPVPIVVDRERRFVLGGAANVAANVAALGGKAILISAIGRDGGGKIVKKLCKEKKVNDQLVEDPARRTTIKNRIIVGHHQVLRVDTEDKALVAPRTEAAMIKKLVATHADIVVFSDYAKGIVTKKLVAAAKKKFGAKNVLADFKPSQADFFSGIGAIFPNLKEAHELTGIRAETAALAEKVISLLAERFNSGIVLKRSEHGMTLRENKRSSIAHLPARTHEIFDVTGAGDTVIAVMALALGAGAPFTAAAEIANHAAGIVIEKEGTAVLSLEELVQRTSAH